MMNDKKTKMAENTCEFMEDCPTKKTLTEIIGREEKANVGSMNYFIHSQATLDWLEGEFCEHKKPGFTKTPSGEKKYVECPTYAILKAGLSQRMSL